jgi:hypothetical protein
MLTLVRVRERVEALPVDDVRAALDRYGYHVCDDFLLGGEERPRRRRTWFGNWSGKPSPFWIPR